MTTHSRVYWLPRWWALMQVRLAAERAAEAEFERRTAEKLLAVISSGVGWRAAQ